MLADVPWRWEVVKSTACDRKRLLVANNEPGLGIEVDEERAKDHPFRQEVMHSLSIRAPDNAILDW